tara:strand:- start:4133 stop:4288 length:156 start_codon:yes stop_codon:yes gene_type:complete
MIVSPQWETFGARKSAIDALATQKASDFFHFEIYNGISILVGSFENPLKNV